MALSESQVRSAFKEKKRIIVKIGSSSLTHAETGAINLNRVEKLVRQLCDLRNQGKDVVLVSSGAIAVGRKAVGMNKKPQTVCQKQACASIGQARLMMNYQKLFSEYDQVTGQILMTKYTILNPIARQNAHNTMEELFRMGIIPVVNENDTIATDEIHFGDNDTLSALVASLTKADLLILLSDIDGLYTDDPHTNPNAELISFVNEVSSEVEHMAGTTQSDVGTGGMTTKLSAARIASRSGADMVIANGEDLSVIQAIMEGEKVGTVFAANPDDSFKLEDYIAETEQERNLNRRQV